MDRTAPTTSFDRLRSTRLARQKLRARGTSLLDACAMVVGDLVGNLAASGSPALLRG